MIYMSLRDRNDIHEWVLGAHFRSLIDLEQEMVTYAQVKYTDFDDNVWIICVLVDRSSRRLCNSSM